MEEETATESTLVESIGGEGTDLSQRSAFQLRNGLPVNKETKQTMIYARHLQRPRVSSASGPMHLRRNISSAEDITGSARHEM